MTISDIKKIFNNEYFDFSIKDSTDEVMKVMGLPIDIYEQKKYKIKIFKYKYLQLTFISDFLEFYSISFIDNEIFISFEMLNKHVFTNGFLIQKNEDFFSVKVKDNFEFIFSSEDEYLFEIRVK